MPSYTVEYDVRLTDKQMDELAEAITTLHSERFSTPRLFVNVEFIDAKNKIQYAGAKRRGGNHIRGNIRSRPLPIPPEIQKVWDDVCLDLESEWNRIVRPSSTTKGLTDADGTSMALHSAEIIAGMIAAVEIGFTLPKAGENAQWIDKNWDAFNKKAAEGDPDFIDLVEDIERRGLLTKD